MKAKQMTIGVDLGGTKLVVAAVDSKGRVTAGIRRQTDVQGGPAAVVGQVTSAIEELRRRGFIPSAVGLGVAGQIDGETGTVRFGPNLNWCDVPLGLILREALRVPVVVTNDVRAATWGEWLYGAGRGCDDLICLFVGTGIGGGVVSGGRVLTGASNTAGELGHMIVDLNGPPCDCGSRGCLEALAGGRAMARHARQAVARDPEEGAGLLNLAGGDLDAISMEVIAQAYQGGDPLARRLVDGAVRALIAGAASLVNAFNPRRLILGGGVVQGLPEIIPIVDQGLRQLALPVATQGLEVMGGTLGHQAGVTGAAALARRISQS